MAKVPLGLPRWLLGAPQSRSAAAALQSSLTSSMERMNSTNRRQLSACGPTEQQSIDKGLWHKHR